MRIKSISDTELFKVFNPEGQHIAYGCSQEWYTTKWQRLSGCGPSTASHLYYYLSQIKQPSSLEDRINSREEWLNLMNEIWLYVTPSIRGVHKTKLFYEPLQAFALAKGLTLDYQVLEIDKSWEKRPPLLEIINFLAEALDKDAPVAFLNLCNGDECSLDRWHWVTIYSLEYSEDKDLAYVSILDQGQIKRIDLALWLRTTTLGGGFVYFRNRDHTLTES